MQMVIWKFKCVACEVTGRPHLPLCICLIHVPVLAATKWEQPKTKTKICLLILHFKSLSLALDTTYLTLEEIGSVYSTYAGIEKCTQNFLFFKLSMLTLTPTKPPAPGTLSPRVKYPGHATDDSHPSNANIKNKWRYSSTPLYALNSLHWDFMLSFTWGGEITWKTYA